MDMPAIITQLAVLFIVMFLGFIACKLKAVPQDSGGILTKVVLNITLPCTILSSVISGDLKISGGETAFFMLMSIIVLLIPMIIAIPGVRLMGGSKKDHGLYAVMIFLGNVGFMGFPVTNAIFGPESAFYVALNIIPFQILSFSLGTLLIAGKSGKFDFKVLCTPATITSVCVIPLAISGFAAPAIIATPINLVGSMTTPCSMLVIGIVLAKINFRDMFSNWRLHIVALVKLTLMPVVTWLILRQIISNELILGVLVVLSGMPTAAVVAMFAIEYDGNERIASGGVFLTTLLSGVTVPLVVYLLLR